MNNKTGKRCYIYNFFFFFFTQSTAFRVHFRWHGQVARSCLFILVLIRTVNHQAALNMLIRFCFQGNVKKNTLTYSSTYQIQAKVQQTLLVCDSVSHV